VDCGAGVEIASGLTALTYTDTTGVPNTTYYYRVEAVSECGVAAGGAGGCQPGTDLAGTSQEPGNLDQDPGPSR